MFGRNASHVLLLRRNNQEVLLALRRDLPMWVLPGGQLAKNESFKVAARREFFEETGLRIVPTKLVVHYKSPDKKVVKEIYLGKYTSGKLTLSDETKALRWYRIGNLPYPMTLYERTRIADALRGISSPVYKTVKLNLFNELAFHLFHPLTLTFLVVLQLNKTFTTKSNGD